MNRRYDFRRRNSGRSKPLEEALEALALIEIRPLPDRMTPRRDVFALVQPWSGVLIRTTKNKLYASHYDHAIYDRDYRLGYSGINDRISQDIKALCTIGALEAEHGSTIAKWLDETGAWHSRQDAASNMLWDSDNSEVITLTKRQKQRLEKILDEVRP